MANAVWGQLEKSHWIADGREGAPRTVYVFTDPNCPYCNKLWADARPWVDAGKLQLRHVMVGILTPTSAGKAAALLGAKDPAAALDAYERGHAASNAKLLVSGCPKPLGDEGVEPLGNRPACARGPTRCKRQVDGVQRPARDTGVGVDGRPGRGSDAPGCAECRPGGDLRAAMTSDLRLRLSPTSSGRANLKNRAPDQAGRCCNSTVHHQL